MSTVAVRSQTGSPSGSVDLDPAFFGIEPNTAVLHQVVTAQLAAARSGTHSTLTRAEVRGGGRKPWKQKGTGRARHGSIRAPQWTGGGVAMGPKPRDYRQKTPKKMVQLALRSALSDRARTARIAVVDAWEFPEPRTKDASNALDSLGFDGRVLLVLGRDDEMAAKSFRNIGRVHVLLADELNAYDVLCSDWVVFTRGTLPGAAVDVPDDGARSQVIPVDDEPAPGAAVASDSPSEAAPPEAAAEAGGEGSEDHGEEAP